MQKFHHIKNHLNVKIFLSAIIIVCIAIGAGYIYYTRENFIRHVETEAIGLAKSAEAFLPTEEVRALAANASDVEKPEYAMIKNSLEKFKESHADIRFAYLLTQKNGKIYFMVDSEAPDSAEYSPPGQEYYEATAMDRQPFLDGKSILTEPAKDRWGTWVSALVPVKDLHSEEIIALLGVDYPADEWNAQITAEILRAVVIVLSILLLLAAFYRIQVKNMSLKQIGKKLETSETLFRTVFSQAPVGIAIIEEDKQRVTANPMYEKIMDRTQDELTTLSWVDITHPDDLAEDIRQFEQFKSEKIDGYTMEKRYIRPDGSYIWVNMVITGLHLNDGRSQSHLCILQDIQERKQTEAALRESERSKTVLLANLPGMAYRCQYDRNWTMLFLSDGCFDLTGYKAEELLDNKTLSYNELIAQDYRDVVWREWERILPLRIPFRYEYEIITATGERKWVMELGQGIYDDQGQVEALEGIVVDITRQRERETQILYMGNHDFLTGLYNRQYFEKEKNNLDQEACLPLSMIIGDINGVRLINDALGLAEGDHLIAETAKIILNCCREKDLLARTGGDEFSILMPQTDQAEAHELMQKIKHECEVFNLSVTDKAQYISLSIGHATKHSKDENIQVVTKEAEEYMYKRKLLERKSYHSAILSSITATMFARSQETEEHSERIAVTSKLIGEKMQLQQKDLADLHLLSMLHDIGKVGIDDRILNKPGKLSDKEWAVMKKHPEIGYRIAMASPELESIAEYILSHHERWDGQGYPQGLKGEEIPLLSRILAVSDSYDAMTEDRVYRKALTKEAAIAEIRKNAGTQFDPDIARLFIESIQL